MEVIYASGELTIKGETELTFNERGINDIFMLSKIVCPDGTTKNLGTDWVSPFKFRCAENTVSGATEIHTGGCHGTNGGSGGNPTGYTDSVVVRVDGAVLSDNHTAYGKTVEIEVTNYITAWNTISDGVGRDSLKEIDRYVYDGRKLDITIELVALEELTITYYHGIQVSAYASKIQLIGENVKTDVFDYSTNASTQYTPKYAIAKDASGNCLEMYMDDVGIAKSTHADTKFYIADYGKAGWNLVYNYTGETLLANEKTYCHCGYVFERMSAIV